jgi:hypothetical protein
MSATATCPCPAAMVETSGLDWAGEEEGERPQSTQLLPGGECDDIWRSPRTLNTSGVLPGSSLSETDCALKKLKVRHCHACERVRTGADEVSISLRMHTSSIAISTH